MRETSGKKNFMIFMSETSLLNKKTRAQLHIDIWGYINLKSESYYNRCLCCMQWTWVWPTVPHLTPQELPLATLITEQTLSSQQDAAPKQVTTTKKHPHCKRNDDYKICILGSDKNICSFFKKSLYSYSYALDKIHKSEKEH